jgi:uncharacterized protein (TIGR02598 family)
MKSRPFHSSAAFSLVEVAVALGIAVSCLVTVLALIPIGLKTGQDSIEETEAAFLMTSLVADLKFTRELTPGGSVNTKTGLYEMKLPWQRSNANSLPIPAVAENDKETYFYDFQSGKLTDELNMGSRFLVDVIYVRVGDAKALEPILAQVNIYWPPAAAASSSDRENAGGVFSTIVSLPVPPFNAEL